MNERHHDEAFYALLDRILPDWRTRRECLNPGELRH